MIILAPLEQFEVYDICSLLTFLVLGIFNISVTNSTFFIGLTLCILIFTFDHIKFISFLIPTKWQMLHESVLSFITNLVKENVGLKHLNNIIYIIWFLFSIILLLNLLGMIPYSFTVTSHFVITFSLALSLFIGINIVGIIKHGKNMIRLFAPEGSPRLLLPLLFVIEIISYLSRVFSLSIRLFANLMSGHTLLKILAGFAWSMLLAGGITFFNSLFPFIIIFLVTGLEVAIGALQAYVFCMLICLYYNDVIHLH
jgi:ATP synthase subunit 6